jgi:hypothetical protein
MIRIPTIRSTRVTVVWGKNSGMSLLYSLLPRILRSLQVPLGLTETLVRRLDLRGDQMTIEVAVLEKHVV